MISKYEFDFTCEAIVKNITRLRNQMWKLIPMYENDEDWGKQLKTVIIEIAGLKEIFTSAPQFLQIFSKLEGLQIVNVDFFTYRKTVFECINLLQELKKEYDK